MLTAKKPFYWFAVLALVAAMLACRLPGSGALTPAPVQSVPTAAPIPQVTSPNMDISPDSDLYSLIQSSLTDLYQEVSPGVVSILVTNQLGSGTGSGFVYDMEGHIITNYHVVEGADTLEVDFPSGFKAYATLVGTDLDSDLAIIKVKAPPEELHPLRLGNSDELQIGQTVVAIGNPFGLNGTMTMGIVSAKGRTLDSMRQTSGGNYFTAGDLIQTDTAINPGNSGGPLLNLDGEVVGVNRAIRTTGVTADGEPLNSGIGFAVSINIVARVAPAIIANGEYKYPYLGVSSLPELTLASQEILGLPRSTGAYITDVVKGSPADKAGLRAGTRPLDQTDLKAGGDLIIAVDGRPVMVFGDMLSYMINNKGPGDVITVTILRGDQQLDLEVTLGERP
ncbi:MAG TPA: trypsin-like peptidase domain-containing protein [Anaerolineaceae bacterium]|mgnify:CR=1 FL=1|nr:trypsin-like peptidase domain-containing protein [Anaerolineaceae bacterium]HPN52096.1 trypsin-like peptidase domain-containing protein [Anaerolineaceae bacterium]